MSSNWHAISDKVTVISSTQNIKIAGSVQKFLLLYMWKRKLFVLWAFDLLAYNVNSNEFQQFWAAYKGYGCYPFHHTREVKEKKRKVTSTYALCSNHIVVSVTSHISGIQGIVISQVLGWFNWLQQLPKFIAKSKKNGLRISMRLLEFKHSSQAGNLL